MTLPTMLLGQWQGAAADAPLACREQLPRFTTKASRRPIDRGGLQASFDVLDCSSLQSLRSRQGHDDWLITRLDRLGTDVVRHQLATAEIVNRPGAGLVAGGSSL